MYRIIYWDKYPCTKILNQMTYHDLSKIFIMVCYLIYVYDISRNILKSVLSRISTTRLNVTSAFVLAISKATAISTDNDAQIAVKPTTRRKTV